MWVMIVLSSYFIEGSRGRSLTSPAMTTVEFTTRQRCIEAVKFTKQQPKIYNAFCVQK